MSIRTLHEQTLSGPNRDRGNLISFALKGDIQVRLIEDTESEEQALVVTGPEEALAKVGYELVRQIEQRQADRRPNVRVKD